MATLVEGEMEGAVGCAPHIDKEAGSYVLVAIVLGKEALRVRLTANEARRLGQALAADADVVELWSRDNAEPMDSYGAG